MDMIWLFWDGIIIACALGSWLIARGPARRAIDGMRFDRARLQFRLHREWLEATFLGALSRSDPDEARRWDDARWLDDVRWARDRQTHRLLALIGVEFEPGPFDDEPARHATALFEYRKGRWLADGARVDALGPDEALRRHRRYEPVTPPRPRA